MRLFSLSSLMPSLLLLGLILSPLSAQAAPPQSVADYLEPGMNAVSVPLQSDGSSVVLVSIDGQESFLTQDGRILTDGAQIQSLLERSIALSSTFDATLNESKAMLGRLQILRVVPEAKCAQYAALDRPEFPCIDKASCVRTANTNPQTATMINAEGFWEAMVDWQADHSTFNTSLNNLESVLHGALPTSDSSTRLQGSMAAVRGAFDQFMHNDLYRTRYDADCTKFNRSRCFEFCARTNWSEEASWSAMESRWGQISALLAALPDQSLRAQALARTTNEWLNYSANRPSLMKAMANELDARQAQLAIQLSRPNLSWNDSTLALAYVDWKTNYNTALGSASAGRVRYALSQKSALLQAADNLSARIDQNDANVRAINNSMTSIRLALVALGNANSSQTDAIAASFAVLKSATTPPIAASQLSTLQKQASDLETLALTEAARAQLGAPASSSNVSAQAQTIVPVASAVGGNNTPVLSANISNASNPPSSFHPFGLPCAVPIAGIAFLLALASISHKQRS